MKKNIVFDFDDTLTKFDTIYPFFEYCDKSSFIYHNIKKIFWIISLIFYKTHIIDNYTLKKFGIKLFLKNITYEEIKFKSEQFIKKIVYHEKVINCLKTHIQDNDNIIISSASFNEYLSLFAKKYKNLCVLSSTLEYKNNKIVGLKFNNYSKLKLNYFCKYDINNIDILYTDSFSDKYLAKISKQIIIVQKDGNLIKLNSYKQFVDYFKGNK